MIPWGYTVPAVASVLAVVVLELRALRTGLFRKPALLDHHRRRDRLPDPGRRLADQASHRSSLRPRAHHGGPLPWDIPVEDFLFGYALVTAVLLLWERAAQKEGAE